MPVNPLIGAIYLNSLDRAFEKVFERTGLFYVRFMDDILVLAQTRWAIRRAMRLLVDVLDTLGLERHKGKTFIGLISRGFDFLGYHLMPGRIAVAAKTLQAFRYKCSRLYKQERCTPNIQTVCTA